MILWTEEEVREALLLSPPPPQEISWKATGLSMDSRLAQQGDLFVALRGESVDGHDYLSEAAAKGIVAALVEKEVPDLPCPQIVVPNTFQALWTLARVRRQQSQAFFLAVTGSVGKTSTKEMLRTVFAGFALTEASRASYNNQFGVPYTLASLAKETRYAVIEVGMNHVGEMEPLVELIRPHMALITTIGVAHQGNFNSLQEIVQEKSMIFSHLTKERSVAVLNLDEASFDFLKKQALSCGAQTLLTFGETETADIQLLSYKKQESGGVVVARLKDQEISYQLKGLGLHSARNSLLVMAAVVGAGLDPLQAIPFLEKAEPVQGRGRLCTLTLNSGAQVTLIDDAYNSNPQSLEAGLKVLADTVPPAGGRRVAVLGDMLELGEEAVAIHEKVAEWLKNLSIDLVFVTGNLMPACYEQLEESQKGGTAPTAGDLGPLVKSHLKPGDVVFVKGSLGSRIHQVVTFLLQG